MIPSSALALGVGIGLCIEPTLSRLLGPSWTGLLGLAMVIGACIAWWRQRDE